MSDPALRSIRRFSRWTWAIGAVVLAVAAFLVVPYVGIANGRVIVDDGAPEGGDRIYPYHEDHPVELELVDGRVTGDQRGGWIPFDADAEPISLRLDPSHDPNHNPFGYDYVEVFQSAGEGESVTRPPSLDALWDTDDIVYAAPAATDGRLWFSVSDAAWEVIVEPLTATPIEAGEASGSGDAMLSYRGDALSARFTHTGSGFLRVTVIAPATRPTRDPAVNDVDDFTTRASWSMPGTVLFKIESSGGEWSVDVDE